MIDPIFWLGLSILLVAVSLTAVLVTAIPALQEVARAARSAEKLFDTLRRDLPPTLEAIRLTGLEISELTDDVSDGVKSASQVVKQVDRSIDGAKKQAQKVELSTRSVFAGMTTAWKTFNRPSSRLSPSQRELLASSDRLEYIQENELGDDVEIVNNSRPKAPIMNDPEDE
ncbi:hypothetical protein [Synechocystis sp. PCC 7509]|uniref:hypothetical protein n=1 Tax=Synechocystis sp. PCC 7509 TaxID=927677 RepID=UPI0002AD074A|nr:hypothetical protein [Synechocystis sp. PCC 7509]